MSDHTNPDDEKARDPASVPVSGETPEPGEADASGQPEVSFAQLKEIIAALQAESDSLRDQNLRLLADMENLRKRTEREKDETAKYAITRFARDVVTVADNFERAVQAVPPGAAEEDAALKSLVEGVSMTEREFLNVLERYGVRRVDPKGEMFNPHQHQAMMETQNADVVPGMILEVYQPGYMIEDRILRPAMVVVAKGGAKPARPAEDAPGGIGSGANDDAPAAADTSLPPREGNAG